METARPRSNPWLVLGILLTIYIFNFADRYLLTGLVGPIKAEFGVGDNLMGLLMGPAFVVFYVLMGVPFARLADRSSRVRIIAAGCMMWSLATAATGLATGPISLALARVAVGLGEAAFVAPAWASPPLAAASCATAEASRGMAAAGAVSGTGVTEVWAKAAAATARTARPVKPRARA